MLARTVILLPIVGGCLLFAQASREADTLTPLRVRAEQTTTAWFAVHQAMEDNLARLLPCDPRIKTAIDAVARASDERMDAWTRYLSAWRRQTAADATKTRDVIARHQVEVASIQRESEQIVRDLSELRRMRAGLPAGAQAIQNLEEIIDLTSRRASAFSERKSTLETAGPLLDQVLGPAQKTAAAVAAEADQLPGVAAKWRAYYAARIQRAETECGITGQVVKPRARARRKKK